MFLDDIQVVKRVRRTDPQTSKVAAANTVNFVGGHKGRILMALLQWGDMGPKQIAPLVRLDSHQVTKRRKEMIDEGLIRIKHLNGEPVLHEGCEVWRQFEEVIRCVATAFPWSFVAQGVRRDYRMAFALMLKGSVSVGQG